MFNLFRSRDKMVRFMLGALLVLVSLSMLTYLIPSYGSGTGTSDTVIAEVGKEKVMLMEVQRAVQQAMRGRQIPAEFLPHYVPQMIDQMVTEQAMAYEAKRLGYQVSDADVANAIRQIMPNLFQDGKFVGKDAYAMVLSQQNLTIAEFEQSLSRQLLISKLRDVVLQGTLVSAPEIEQEYKHRNQKAKIEYVKISGDKIQAKISTEQVRAYFEQHKAEYRTPEKRNLAIIVIDQAKLEQNINPTDADLERLYNQGKDRFRTPDRVKVRHILLKTTDKTPAQEAQIKAKAEELLKEIKAKNGANFADLAKKFSEDTASAVKGGEIPDWVVKGQMVPEFEKASFTLKPNEISDLVKTQYGYHIVQVLAKEPARLQPFPEVKAQLAGEYKKQHVTDMMQSLSDKTQSALAKDPQHPEKIAADLHVDLIHANQIGSGDAIPGIGQSKDFDESIAALKKGEVSQPVLLPGDKLAMAAVEEVIPSHPASFEEAESKVSAALTKDTVSKLVDQRANELAEKTKSMNGDLAKAAKSMGLEIKTSDEFDRAGAIEGLGSAGMIPDVFTKPVGSVLGPVAVSDAKVVYKVLAQSDANLGNLATQRESIRDEIKNRKARNRSALFEDGLREALMKEGKIKIHQDVVNRLIANYRG